MTDKKLIIGCDHAGFELKQTIIEYVQSLGYETEDIGIYEKEAYDYPIIAKKLALEILNNKHNKGILICGTGLGMAIMANRFKGIRAVVVSDTCSAKMSRSHNNANVLCIGQRILGEELAKDIVKTWLETEFQGERHANRVAMLDEL